MNKVKSFVSAICFILFVITSVNAQKNVKRILDYYQSEAYHLTIKKINDLKGRQQVRPDLQLILADCYWQTGNKKRSTEVYESVAFANEIPDAFKEKYKRALSEKERRTLIILDPIPAIYFAIPTTQPESIGSIVQPVYRSKKSKTDMVLFEQKAVEIPEPDNYIEMNASTAAVSLSNYISVDTLTLTPTVEKTIAPPVEKAVEAVAVEAKQIKEKKAPVTSNLSNIEAKSQGKYRIRFKATTDEEASTLTQIVGLSEVKIYEWAKKKIVIGGHFDSPKLAQAFIDNHLKAYSSKVVVVTKTDGRYKSVAGL